LSELAARVSVPKATPDVTAAPGTNELWGRVIDIDDIGFVAKLVERGLHRRREFTVGQQDFGAAVF